jgi:hypothetical protein
MSRVVLADLAAKVVYVSGPMTGYVEFNYPAFEAAAVTLRAEGVVVVSPHEVNPADGVEREWAWYLRRDIAAMLGADAIVRLAGADASRGAALECHIGKALGMPVYEYDDLVTPDTDRAGGRG